MPPSVSVVIPTYNNASLLGHAIQSVREQKHPDLEIIIIDDGSTDNTTQLLENLKGSDLRSLKQINSGPAASRNRGIAEAAGEWIAFLDADDYWLPGKLEAQFEKLQHAPDADFSYTDARLVWSNGNEVVARARNSNDDLFSDLVWGNQLATGTMLVRRRCFEQVGTFNTRLRTAEDWDMWLRLAAAFESVYVDQPLTCCRAPEHRAHKYGLGMLEECSLEVVDGVFDLSPKKCNPRNIRGPLFAWHYAVLAKSYLRYGHWKDFLRLTARSLRSDTAGWSYMLPHRVASRWKKFGANKLPAMNQ